MTTTATTLTREQIEALDIARQLAEAGVPIFVAPPSAERLGEFYLPKGWQHVRPDPGIVDRWQPGWALCAVMGQGMDLVDEDGRNGGDIAVFDGSMPRVLAEVATPSGGRHFFVSSLGVRSRDGFLPGIDFKGGDGAGEGRGFAYIAPTVRPSKLTGERVAYRWTRHPDIEKIGAPDDSGAALRALVRQAHGQQHGDGHSPSSAGDSIPEGRRNAELTRLAGVMRRPGMSEGSIIAALLVENVRCDPPLPEDEVRGIAVSVARYAPASRTGINASAPGPEITPDFPRTDAGNGELIAFLYQDRVRYDHRRGRWLVYHTHWWVPDDIGAVVQMAKEAARWRLGQAAAIDDDDQRKKAVAWASTSESRKAIDAALALARTEPGIAERGDGWDADPWLLGVENGVLDLRSGGLRDGRPADRITKHAPVVFDPAATCPTWDAFLALVQPDAEMRAYLRRRAGYALTANVGEQDIAFLHGGGANGKSTYAVALQDVLGADYATQAAPGLLLRHYGDRHPTEIADLDGMRLVVSTEVDDGRALAEDLVKQLTGGDRLKGRRMRQDFFAFEATFKIMLLANHKPVIRGQDLAIWRRIKQVPWDVTIPEADRDPHFRDRLRPEAAGILNWMLAGCLDLQRHGMQEPAAVTEATAAYRAESNPVGAFIEERCLLDSEGSVSASVLYQAYAVWAGGQGLRGRELLSSTAFGRHVGALFERHKTMAGNEYRGLRLRARLSMEGSMKGFESDDRNSHISGLHTPREGSYRKNPSNPAYRPSGESDSREASCWRCREPLADDTHSICADCGWLRCYCGVCSPECVEAAL